MSDHNYGVRYTVETGGFEKEELRKAGDGGCDALILCSIVREGNDPHEGGVSFCWFNIDGREHGPAEDALEIPGTQLFQAWSLWAKDLSEREDLPLWQRKILQNAFDDVRMYITNIEG